MFARNKRPRQLNGGYTLLELMIVLAILVSVIAISWPRVVRRMQLIGPREAALQLTADLAEAREGSITSGEAWVLRIERGGSRYEIGPVSAIREELSATNSMMPLGADGQSTLDSRTAGNAPAAPIVANLVDPTTADSAMTQIRPSELPSGMIFDDGFAHSASEANAIRVAETAELPPSTNVMMETVFDPLTPVGAAVDNWKFAVIFQPDGRSTESEILLKEQATENKIRLRIRGFTGGVTIDKLERKQALEPNPLAPNGTDAQELDSRTADPTKFDPAFQSSPTSSDPVSSQQVPR